jgi:hypothetical protein
MQYLWVLMHGETLWGLYSTETLAQKARSRAARILGVTIYDESFNLYRNPVDWLSSTERQLEDAP